MRTSKVDVTYAVSLPESIDENTLKLILEEILIDKKAEIILNLIVTNDNDLKRLNQKFRGLNNPTDVLSFDLSDAVHPCDQKSGEIYISFEQARKQSIETHRSFQKIIAQLAVHGTLHLLGFEHYTETGHNQMQKQEINYLSRLK